MDQNYQTKFQWRRNRSYAGEKVILKTDGELNAPDMIGLVIKRCNESS